MPGFHVIRTMKFTCLMSCVLLISPVGGIFKKMSKEWLEGLNTVQLNYGVAVSDVDHDGRMDWIVAGFSGKNFVLKYDHAQRKLMDIAQPGTPFAAIADTIGNARGVCACDIDGDGREEIYVTNANSARNKKSSRGDRLFKWRNGKYVDLYRDEVNADLKMDVKGGYSVACLDRFGAGTYGFLIATHSRSVLNRYRLIELDWKHPSNDLSNGMIVLRDAAEEAGISETAGGRGVAVGPIFGVGGMSDILFNNGFSYRLAGSAENILYRNVGNGMFTKATPRAISDPHSDGRGATIADFNADGKLDILLSNWLGKDKLYIQDTLTDGSSHFKEKRLIEHSHSSTKASLVADFDNDGNIEIYLNKLYHFGRRSNKLFKVLSHGSTVLLRDMAVGDATELERFGTGGAVADINGDGRLDMLLSHGEVMQDPLEVYTTNTSNRFLRVMPTTLYDAPARGAKVTLITMEGRRQTRVIDCGSGYLNQMEPVAHFGMLDSVPIKVIILWPDSKMYTYDVDESDINSLHTIPYPKDHVAMGTHKITKHRYEINKNEDGKNDNVQVVPPTSRLVEGGSDTVAPPRVQGTQIPEQLPSATNDRQNVLPTVRRPTTGREKQLKGSDGISIPDRSNAGSGNPLVSPNLGLKQIDESRDRKTMTSQSRNQRHHTSTWNGNKQEEKISTPLVLPSSSSDRNERHHKQSQHTKQTSSNGNKQKEKIGTLAVSPTSTPDRDENYRKMSQLTKSASSIENKSDEKLSVPLVSSRSRTNLGREETTISKTDHSKIQSATKERSRITSYDRVKDVQHTTNNAITSSRNQTPDTSSVLLDLTLDLPEKQTQLKPQKSTSSVPREPNTLLLGKPTEEKAGDNLAVPSKTKLQRPQSVMVDHSKEHSIDSPDINLPKISTPTSHSLGNLPGKAPSKFDNTIHHRVLNFSAPTPPRKKYMSTGFRLRWVDNGDNNSGNKRKTITKKSRTKLPHLSNGHLFAVRNFNRNVQLSKEYKNSGTSNIDARQGDEMYKGTNRVASGSRPKTSTSGGYPVPKPTALKQKADGRLAQSGVRFIHGSRGLKPCNVVVTHWQPCSRSCGGGVSVRLSNDNSRCFLRQERKRCNSQRCLRWSYMDNRRRESKPAVTSRNIQQFSNRWSVYNKNGMRTVTNSPNDWSIENKMRPGSEKYPTTPKEKTDALSTNDRNTYRDSTSGVFRPSLKDDNGRSRSMSPRRQALMQRDMPIRQGKTTTYSQASIFRPLSNVRGPHVRRAPSLSHSSRTSSRSQLYTWSNQRKPAAANREGTSNTNLPFSRKTDVFLSDDSEIRRRDQSTNQKLRATHTSLAHRNSPAASRNRNTAVINTEAKQPSSAKDLACTNPETRSRIHYHDCTNPEKLKKICCVYEGFRRCSENKCPYRVTFICAKTKLDFSCTCPRKCT